MGLLDFVFGRRKRDSVNIEENGEAERRLGDSLIEQGRVQLLNAEECGRRAAERGEFNELMKQQAAIGNPVAQNNLGVIYENGYGDVTRDYKQAAGWYAKSAEQGFAMAQHNLAVLYENGHGVSKDEHRAFELYLKAARQGYAASQYNLGVFFAVGGGVQKDLKASLEWYGQAAKQGFGNSTEMVADVKREMHETITRTLEFATSELLAKLDPGNLKIASEQGDGAAQCNLAVHFESEGDFAQAAKWYRRAAEQGQSHAQYNLGVLLHNGRGVRQNLAEAVQWYEKAARQHYVNAIYNLAFMRENGYGCVRDLKAEFQLYNDAANHDEPDSQCKLALLLLDHRLQAQADVSYRNEGWDFVPADHDEAKTLLQKASSQGSAVATHALKMLGWQ